MLCTFYRFLYASAQRGPYPGPGRNNLTMVQSCHETLLDPGDYHKGIQKGIYPIVICYNGFDHYVPTRPISQAAWHKWKLSHELAPILSAGLLVIEELQRDQLEPQLLDAVNEVEACILKNWGKFNPKGSFSSPLHSPEGSKKRTCFFHDIF